MKEHQPLLFFGTLWLIVLLAAMLKIRELKHEVAELKVKEPTVIYTVDNAGGVMSFEDRLDEFRRQLISGVIYSSLPGKNEETLAMISLYRYGAPLAKLEANRWLQKVMEGVE